MTGVPIRRGEEMQRLSHTGEDSHVTTEAKFGVMCL